MAHSVETDKMWLDTIDVPWDILCANHPHIQKALTAEMHSFSALVETGNFSGGMILRAVGVARIIHSYDNSNRLARFITAWTLHRHEFSFGAGSSIYPGGNSLTECWVNELSPNE